MEIDTTTELDEFDANDGYEGDDEAETDEDAVAKALINLGVSQDTTIVTQVKDANDALQRMVHTTQDIEAQIASVRDDPCQTVMIPDGDAPNAGEGPSSESAVQDRGANREVAQQADYSRRLYSRWKFWQVMLGVAGSVVGGVVSSVILWALSSRTPSPLEAATDDSYPPQASITLGQTARTYWQTRALADAMNDIARYAGLTSPRPVSLYAQWLMMNDLQWLVPQPDGEVSGWQQQDLSPLVADVASQFNVTDPNGGVLGSPGMYRYAANLERDGNPVTFHEAVTVCQYALGTVIVQLQTPAEQ
jgi:hypothetical protein